MLLVNFWTVISNGLVCFFPPKIIIVIVVVQVAKNGDFNRWIQSALQHKVLLQLPKASSSLCHNQPPFALHLGRAAIRKEPLCLSFHQACCKGIFPLKSNYLLFEKQINDAQGATKILTFSCTNQSCTFFLLYKVYTFTLQLKVPQFSISHTHARLNESHGHLNWYQNLQLSGLYHHTKFERNQPINT